MAVDPVSDLGEFDHFARVRTQIYLLSRSMAGEPRKPHDRRNAAEDRMDERFASERFDEIDLGLQSAGSVVGDRYMFRPESGSAPGKHTGGKMFIGGVPMNPATNSFAGRS